MRERDLGKMSDRDPRGSVEEWVTRPAVERGNVAIVPYAKAMRRAGALVRNVGMETLAKALNTSLLAAPTRRKACSRS